MTKPYWSSKSKGKCKRIKRKIIQNL